MGGYIETLQQQIDDVLNTGREVGLQTVKACCQEKYRNQVETRLAEMVEAGSVIELRKHRYKKDMNGNTKRP